MCEQSIKKMFGEIFIYMPILSFSFGSPPSVCVECSVLSTSIKVLGFVVNINACVRQPIWSMRHPHIWTLLFFFVQFVKLVDLFVDFNSACS